MKRLLLAAATGAIMGSAIAAGAASEQITTIGGDELIVTYPGEDANHIAFTLTYRNSARTNSKPGQHAVITDHGPVIVHILVSVAETLTILDWPQELWPTELQIEVKDGEEGEIVFLRPMM